MRKLQSALILTTLLAATITSESLWTDEAFSAFMASHRSLAACWSTLAAGDSSDLQMVGYYLYLHGWIQLFGQSEIAFRTANIPFVALFSGVLIWASQRLFQSQWVWVVAALSPLVVLFSNNTRPYFDIIAMSLTCVACLLVYLQSPGRRERKILPWIALASVLMGATFHMLTLLSVLPLLVVLVVFQKTIRWGDWKWPVIGLSPLGLGLMAYLVWTLGRGTHYDYAPPDLASMASALFRFAGLSGYAPNWRYDIPTGRYIGAMSLALIAFLGGLLALCLAMWNVPNSNKLMFKALLYALGTGIVQAFLLSFALHQQIEFRHLSSLLPLLLLLLMAGLSVGGRYAVLAAAAIGLTWLISDATLLFSPDYKREDFRAAVQKTIALQKATDAGIAVVADPVASAYYGLDVKGPKPCFPLTDSCEEGFRQVPWQRQTEAEYALFWTPSQITAWLDAHQNSVVLISRARLPNVKNSAWWPLLQTRAQARIYPLHGFYVYLITTTP